MEGLVLVFSIERSCSINFEIISEVSTKFDLIRTREISSTSDFTSDSWTIALKKSLRALKVSNLKKQTKKMGIFSKFFKTKTKLWVYFFKVYKLQKSYW